MLSSARGLRRFCLRWPGLVVFAVVIGLSALLSTFLGPQPLAEEHYTWPGSVVVSEESGEDEMGSPSITLNLQPGETKTYYLRLTARPVELVAFGRMGSRQKPA